MISGLIETAKFIQDASIQANNASIVKLVWSP